MKHAFINHAPQLYQNNWNWRSICKNTLILKINKIYTSRLRGVTLKSVFTILTTQTFTCFVNSNYKSCRAEEDSHRLLHLGKTASVWNKVFRSHQEQSPDCSGNLTWDLANEERGGLATRMGLKCDACPFTSKRHNLFKEVETSAPGRKLATLNYSLQVGLSQTPLGNDR